ncbi:hypothetical protein ACIP2X_38165 [Streptomyces sp. NPDC089424]|uniref:hypothetical protein n=1 Tax=Streptomyces sp. NPDC089424 TaxID=3365917 RepID=UPI00381DD663
MASVGGHQPLKPPGGPVNCDCGATREDQTAGIHGDDCTSRDGQPDQASDHYQH